MRFERERSEVSVRVLHLIDSLIQAGAEALVRDMVPRMRTRGVDVSVAVLKELDSPFERELREQGIPFLPTGLGGIYAPSHLLTLRRHIPDFDVVHVYLFPAQLFAPIATQQFGQSRNWPFGAALSFVLLVLVVLALSAHAARYRRGEAGG